MNHKYETPKSAHLELNTTCNLNCTHCYRQVNNCVLNKDVWFKINSGEALMVEEKWQPLPLIVVSFIMGVVVGVFLSLLKYYLKPVRKK